MQAFVVRVDEVIPPLGVPARDAWLLDDTLGKGTLRAFAREGIRVEHVATLEEAERRAQGCPEGAVVVLDSVAFSPQVLREFLRAAREAGPDAALQCALPRATSTDRLSHVSGLEPAGGGPGEAWTAPLYFLRGRSSVSAALPTVLPFKEDVKRAPLPRGLLRNTEAAYGITESFLCNVTHWVHALRLNSSALVLPWAERKRVGYSILGSCWYLWRALLAFPWTGGRVGEAIRLVEPGAQIHHRAHVEVSVIGRKASIGTGAIVKYSYVGEGARIDDGAHVVGSVIGPGAYVSGGSTVVASVLCPGSFAAQQLMQFSMLGEESIALTTSNFYDLNFGRNVRVAYKGRFVDAGDQVLGVCVGPRARVGAGVWVASGREVPAGILLIKDPAEVAFNLEAPDADAPFVVEAGRLRRLSEGIG